MRSPLLEFLRTEIHQLERDLELLSTAPPRDTAEATKMEEMQYLLTQLKTKLAVIDPSSG